ncbi:hypothetical protein V5D56_07880 [Cellulosimicrobium sp. PMB13]|uniref:hypothetical protein n=1 Tax=Cellulosimicrobium sp. PMB13 TaxID=3120158 RepID=UPI003F4B7A6E
MARTHHGPPGSSRPKGPSLVVRSLALGVAAGSRSSLGVAGPVLAARPDGASGTGPVARGAAVLAVAGEVVGDKLPSAPSRLAPPGPAFRMASGALGGARLARVRGGSGAPVVVAAVAGALGAAAGTWGGAAWRGLAVGKRPDWPGAVAEDVVAVALAAWAVRR